MSEGKDPNEEKIVIEIYKDVCGIAYEIGDTLCPKILSIDTGERQTLKEKLKDILSKANEIIEEDILVKGDYIYTEQNKKFKVCRIENITTDLDSHLNDIILYWGYWSLNWLKTLPKTIDEFNEIPKKYYCHSIQESDIHRLKFQASSDEDDIDKRLSDI